MNRMDHRFSSRRLWAGAWVLIACCCFSGAALANPLPPPYRDFPTGPGTFVSWVNGPVLADDFTLFYSGRIGFVEWWGRGTTAPFELKLYANTDANPAAPDGPGLSLGVIQPDVVEPWGGEIFRFGAHVTDPAWAVQANGSYWLSVASLDADWTWAFGDGVPEEPGGSQSQIAVGSPDGQGWNALLPPVNLAFGVTVMPMPEPGSLVLLGLALVGLVVGTRVLARGSKPG